MSQVEQKLERYQEFLSTKGFDNATLEIVLREQTDSHLFFETNGTIEISANLANFVPMGNPPSFMVGYAIEGDKVLSSFFKSQDTAASLRLEGKVKNNITNPLEFAGFLEQAMVDVLVETREGVDTLDTDISKFEQNYSLDIFSNLEGFDSIIYNLLARKPIVFVGETHESLNIMSVLISLIPEEYRYLYGFTINMPYTPNDSIILVAIDDVPQISLEEEVNNFLSREYALVNLFQKVTFSEFNCAYSSRIFKLLQEDKSIQEATQLVQQVFDLAKEVIKGETQMEFAERNNINFDDADLIMEIYKNTIHRGIN